MKPVLAACGVTFVLGAFFLFVRAPHPWGWEGFDHYHELALAVAAGQPFPTMEVPWGYAYFLAFFYRIFGDHPWIPLTAQVVVNASVPLLAFVIARRWFDDRTATLAAILIAVFSFNTIYASTQSSDAVCTVIFMAAVGAFVRAQQRDRPLWFAVAGVLAGLAPQFRPNLILIPVLLALYAVGEHPSRRRLARAGLLLACSAAVLMPWVARNYRLTRHVIPTSVHAGVQLWYGTLQTGPYLTSRAHNPRSIFEGPAFEYTSLFDVPIEIAADVNPCAASVPISTAFTYWTDREPASRRFESRAADGHFAATLPAPGGPLVLYYYFESICAGDREPVVRLTPALGRDAPLVFFVSDDHLGDLDVHGDLLDVFDLVRLVRHAAWHEMPWFMDRLAAAGVADVTRATGRLTPVPATGRTAAAPPRIDADGDRATLVLSDGSTITVPREWSGRITDVGFDGPLALALMHSSASLAELRLAHEAGRAERVPARTEREDVSINRVFYRSEPHMMRRYWALAIDNIRRDPGAFLAACLYRSVRLFVVEGTTDIHTAQQFAHSRVIYAVATIASWTYLIMFVAGAVAARRRATGTALPLLLIAYVPATMAPVLTNMRYSVTVQPLIFTFVAVAITSAIDRLRRRQGAGREKCDRAETRTARQP